MRRLTPCSHTHKWIQGAASTMKVCRIMPLCVCVCVCVCVRARASALLFSFVVHSGTLSRLHIHTDRHTYTHTCARILTRLCLSSFPPLPPFAPPHRRVCAHGDERLTFLALPSLLRFDPSYPTLSPSPPQSPTSAACSAKSRSLA